MNSLIALCADYYWELDRGSRFSRLERTAAQPRLQAGAFSDCVGKIPWEIPELTPAVGQWDALREQIAAQETFRDIEWRWQATPGQACVVSVSGEPVFDSLGGFAGYRGVMHDITARARDELALRRFRAAVDISGDPIFLVDRETMHIIDVNETACRASGYTHEEILEKGPRDFLQDDPQTIEADFDKVIAAGPAGMTHETAARDKDGRLYVFELQRQAICFDGRWVIITSARDVTRRKQAESAAVRLGQMYAAISGTNEAILHARNPVELYRQVCEAAVREGAIVSAAVILPDPASGWTKVAAVTGEGADSVRSVHISFDEDKPEGRGLAGTAFRTRKPCVINDLASDVRLQPWRKILGMERAASGAAIPLLRNDRSVGVLLLYSREKDAFDDEIVQLLQRMAQDIVFALENFDREAERQKAVDALRASEEKYRSILESIEEAYYEVDLTGTLMLCNEAFCRMFGFAMHEIIGLNYSQYHHPDDVSHVFANFNEVFRTGITKKIDWRLQHKNGNILLCEGSIHLVWNGNGEPVGFRGMLRDVTSRREMEAALRESEERNRHLASHDILTGLPNRMMFNQVLGYQVQQARRFDRTFAVMFIDLDHFKAINDNFGHGAGDHLLRETARRLTESVRASDFVARLAGDEFVVIVQEPGDMEQLRSLAQKIVAALRSPVVLAGVMHHVTASVGVCVFPDDGRDEEALLRHADAAMYEVKHSGKNDFRFYFGTART